MILSNTKGTEQVRIITVGEGYFAVYVHDGRWNGSLTYIGTFVTLEDAEKAGSGQFWED